MVILERIVTSAFEIVNRINSEHFVAVVRQGAFPDLTLCITYFCKASRFQKTSLLAIAMLRGIIPVLTKTPELSGQGPNPIDDHWVKLWYPVLQGFYDIIMNGEDLEVRRL
jgi:brefeldin A-inhibited guanine nucleotide-exchange protein